MNRFNFKISLVTFLFVWANIFAQNGLVKAKLDKFQIEGNRKIGVSEIQSWFRFRKGEIIFPDAVRARSTEVLERIKERGYYFAKVDSIAFFYKEDSTKMDVQVRLTEGDRLKVKDAFIEGLSKDSQNLRAELQTRAGKDFRYQLLEEDIETIIQHFENRGYPYCKVAISELRIEKSASEGESNIVIKLQVEPGPLVTIGAIEIRGNKQTKDFVVLREININRGEIYSQRKVDKISPRLLKLGYFNWVNPPRLERQRDGTEKLIIELAEGSQNRFDGVIGYNPPVQNSKGFVTGLIDVSFRNLLGTGRQIEARWERRTSKTQQLRFRYLEPWLAGLPLNAGISFEQLIQDTIYVHRELGLDLRYRFNEHLSFFTQVSRRDVSPDSLGRVIFGLPPSHSINFAAGLTLNTLDYLPNPGKGIFYQTSFEWGRKNINDALLPSSSVNQKRLAVDFETYISPWRWQVLAVGLHGRQITSGEEVISITDQYRLGGARTLRGYREEQFRGSRIAWANIEYRYLLNRRSRFFVFLDGGYFFREEFRENAKIKIEDGKIGYGLGLRLDTRLGLFGVDYGLGEGDGLSNGKVHISLTNEF